MKTLLPLLLLWPCLAAAQPEERVRILFIGNSYTTYGGYNIPRKLNGMARAAGKKVLIRQHTTNGRTLRHHLDNRRARAKVDRRQWDYVVLQEQSWTAVANAEDGMYPAARSLDSLVKRRGGRTVLYLLMPKAYRPDAIFALNGQDTVFYYRLFRDYGHAKDSLQQNHTRIARELGAMLAPVGPAFAQALAERPGLSLYKKDRVHHSKAGAYLAACVFYATLLGESPEGNRHQPYVSPELAAFFQRVAARTVLGDKPRWHLE
jgi:hypothetical protein